MTTDCFGHDHTVSSQPAIAAFEAATYAVGAHRAIGQNLTRALELEPDMVSAWALRSVGNSMLARRETMAAAVRDAAQAAAALTRTGSGTPAERILVEAARLASSGRWNEAAMVLEGHLDDQPLDFLALKMAQGLRFMTGQPQAMLETTTRALRKWGDSLPGYGFVLGCHAFGLEEAGHYMTAEAIGRRAVEFEPSDAWGHHAVSHVLEMSGRTVEGIAWLEASRSLWPDCHNFRFHLAWHLALFHLELGNGPAVLDIYDREVMPTASDDFRDMANAVSLLWRLQQSGFDTGDRWVKLREVAIHRRADVTYVFAALHNLLALVANGEHVAATELVGELGKLCQDSVGEQSSVARSVGIDLAKVLTAGANDESRSRIDLSRLAALLPSLGGSNTQRDLFMRILLVAAQDQPNYSAITQMRKLLRQDDAFSRRLAATRTLGAFAKSELENRRRA